MTREEIHLGDVGTKFLATIMDDDVAVDISTATVKKLRFKGPNGSTKEYDATFETDGTDGKIYYVTVTDDLDEIGIWEWQAYIEMGGGEWNSSKDTFDVKANL